MAAPSVYFAFEDWTSKPNNHVALLDIPTNKLQFADVARLLKNSVLGHALTFEPVMVKDLLNQSGPLENELIVIEAEAYDMAKNVKLLLPAVATILDKMDEVHHAIPIKEYLTNGLSAIKAELERVASFNLLQDEALSSLEQKLEDLSSCLPLPDSTLDDDKEEEKHKDVEGEKSPGEETTEDAPNPPTTEDARDPIPDAIDDDNDDAMVIHVADNHKDLHPSTSSFPNAGDEDNEDDDEDKDFEPQLLDVGTDLGGDDDNDDDDDDFCIQAIPRQP
ncbi:glutamic acid-rich protein-like [Cynara cardunculus var. scolymus]|uniref:glutamic acid-rich protein-like n=1 Tax=Cynara cardunculus var. scolymus TaxID=59895 RepID=UPI000D62545E|nr:glutamic acid-rich protein-like [Cynara cardunculus var. scolymus]